MKTWPAEHRQTKIDPLDTELLIAHALKKPREWVLAHPEYQVSKCVSAQVNKLIKKRASGMPLAYLTDRKEFFGLEFFVNKHVLIPRPETETMVSLALDQLQTSDFRLQTILIDVGTGSGCIPIAIACHCEERTKRATRQSHANPEIASSPSVPRNDIKFFATDISRSALAVARRNVKKHGVKIKFLHGDLLSPIPPLIKGGRPARHAEQGKAGGGDFGQQIIITANLPYLTPQQFASEPSIQHEPRLALVAGKDGLKYYKKLLLQIRQLSKTYNLKPKTYLEIDPSQSSPIKLLIKKYLPQAKIIIHQDLAGRNRVVKIGFPPL